MDLLEARGAQGERHPWERARARALARILRQGGLHQRPLGAVLDVGCGDAYAARTALALAGCAPERLVGVDEGLTEPEIQTLQAAHPGLRLEHDWTAVSSERFDVLLLLDVLEHVQRDAAFLAGLVADHLAPGGAALVTVPAWDALFSAHDRFLGHFRRYSGARLSALARAAGLRIESQGYLFASLLLPRAAARLVEQLRGPGPAQRHRGLGAWRGGPLWTALLTAALDADNRLLERLGRGGWRLPGLSAWVFCRAGVESPGKA